MYIMFQGGIMILGLSNLDSQNKFNNVKYEVFYLVSNKYRDSKSLVN